MESKPHLPSVVSVRYRNELHALEDDWSGTIDPIKRRKLQNRLHQRAWRKRQAVQRKQGGHRTAACAGAQQSSLGLDATSQELLVPSVRLWRCSDDIEQVQQSLSSFADYAYDRYLEGSPRTDLLLTLIRFNVFRALMENDDILGFDKQWLDCDAVSPFHARVHGLIQTYPANLRPTDLQLVVDHHPWIDLLPDTRMRDNILLLGDDYDDGPLCHDVVDNRHGTYSESLIVWGDPHDPENWEIGADFYGKWSTILQGCYRLFHATNSWRARRGERKLFPEALCMP